MTPSQIRTHLIAAIDRRYQWHSTKELSDYHLANHTFQQLDVELIAFVADHREPVRAYLAEPKHREELATYCLNSLQRFTYERNQFINFQTEDVRLLEGQYRAFVEKLGQGAAHSRTKQEVEHILAEALQSHHQQLRLILSSYLLRYAGGRVAENHLLQSVPCQEYSPGFQLDLLGLTLAELWEPILDIGCGAQGALVDHLRRQGLEAYGLDRAAPRAGPYYRQDWLGFDYGQGRWGTIIAHQSFSTHFIYHHLRNGSQAATYAQTYMKILAGLAVDGSFWYAPGLPFIEPAVADLAPYRLSQRPIELDTMLGLGPILYATRVERRA